MANIVASEVTRVSETPIGTGYDLVIQEFYIDHTVAANDVWDLTGTSGVGALVGILGISGVNTSGAVTAISVSAVSSKSDRIDIAAAVAGSTADIVSGSGNSITFLAAIANYIGIYLTLLIKVN